MWPWKISSPCPGNSSHLQLSVIRCQSWMSSNDPFDCICVVYPSHFSQKFSLMSFSQKSYSLGTRKGTEREDFRGGKTVTKWMLPSNCPLKAGPWAQNNSRFIKPEMGTLENIAWWLQYSAGMVWRCDCEQCSSCSLHMAPSHSSHKSALELLMLLLVPYPSLFHRPLFYYLRLFTHSAANKVVEGRKIPCSFWNQESNKEVTNF